MPATGGPTAHRSALNPTARADGSPRSLFARSTAGGIPHARCSRMRRLRPAYAANRRLGHALDFMSDRGTLAEDEVRVPPAQRAKRKAARTARKRTRR